VVFDCGARPGVRKARSVVSQRFAQGEDIDCLFVSHLDEDHINLIPKLRKVCRGIKRVIMPLLHENERIFLSTFYRVIGKRYISHVFHDPQRFFGNDSDISLVETSETESNEYDQLVDLFNQAGVIRSGTSLSMGFMDWVYIPHNYKYLARKIMLESEFEERNIDIDRFANDYGYALTKKKEAKAVYKRLEGNINQNSMMVYSGPSASSDAKWRILRDVCSSRVCRNCMGFCRESNAVGCIYTGDSDFNRVNIAKIFSQELSQVGTVQIPHHGSSNNFNETAFSGMSECYCPISFGITNQYGHPSPRVLTKLVGKGHRPILISENRDSIYIELIGNRDDSHNHSMNQTPVSERGRAKRRWLR